MKEVAVNDSCAAIVLVPQKQSMSKFWLGIHHILHQIIIYNIPAYNSTRFFETNKPPM